MQRRIRQILVTICTLALVLVVFPVGGLASDGFLIVDGDVTLAEDHFGRVFIEPESTLDCAGHTVIGDGSGFGIFISDAANVTVLNCRVTGFNTGVFAAYADGLRLEGNRLFGNNTDGAGIYLSSGVTVERNVAFSNGLIGFKIRSTIDSVFERNTAKHNDTGFWLRYDSIGNTIERNMAINNASWGIDSQTGLFDNRFEDNKCKANGIEDAVPVGVCS